MAKCWTIAEALNRSRRDRNYRFWISTTVTHCYLLVVSDESRLGQRWRSVDDEQRLVPRNPFHCQGYRVAGTPIMHADIRLSGGATRGIELKRSAIVGYRSCSLPIRVLRRSCRVSSCRRLDWRISYQTGRQISSQRDAIESQSGGDAISFERKWLSKDW